MDCTINSVDISLTTSIDLLELKTAKGLALQDMLTEIHAYVHRSKLIIRH